MDDGTSEPLRCEVCGDELRDDNTFGVCADKNKPACAKERRRIAHLRRQQDAPPKPEPERCEICGKALRADNESGLCDGIESPACSLERQRRWRADKPKPDPSSKPEPRRCDVCGIPLHGSNVLGVCSARGKPACRKERDRRSKEGVRDESGRILITLGNVFGKWTALEDSRLANGRTLCRCECGTERYVLNANLVRGISRSCGCEMKAAAERRFPDPYIAAGTVFGRLTVLEDAPQATGTGKVRCWCECGTEVLVAPFSLKRGSTRSCGCLRRDRVSTRGGFTKHPLYGVWRAMIARCTDPNSDSYPNYGGRGITVCDRWMDPWLFVEDIEREIGPRPEGTYESGTPLYTLDRVDNDSGYCPGNMKWSTQSEQVQNQRTVAQLTAELAAARKLLERPRRAAAPAMDQPTLF